MATAQLLAYSILCGLFAPGSAIIFHGSLEQQERFFPVADWFDQIWDFTGVGFGFDAKDDDDDDDDGGGGVNGPGVSIKIQHLSDKVRLPRCTHCKCGQANTRNARLMGGTDLVPFEFPWLVQVQTFGLSMVPGTLINDRYVLTAASAMQSLTPKDLKVVVGMHDICKPDTTSTVLSVASLRLHPEFVERTRQNDIALIRLSEPVIIGPFVAPICLPKWTANPSASPTAAAAASSDARRYGAGHVSTVASWLRGQLRPNLTISDSSCLPRKVGLPVLEVAACVESAARTQGCLGVIGSPSLLCRGDAGAGVMVQQQRRRRRRRRRPRWRRRKRRGDGTADVGRAYVMIGVLSDQQHCEGGGDGGGGGVAWEVVQSFHGLSLPMYTRLTAEHLLEWIMRSTRDACFCGR